MRARVRRVESGYWPDSRGPRPDYCSLGRIRHAIGRFGQASPVHGNLHCSRQMATTSSNRRDDMSSRNERVLASGVTIPLLGYGTYLISNDEAAGAVEAA